MNTNYYIFAGGGTGGHLYPGLAVAEELTQLDPDAKIVFACSNRDIDRRILAPLDYGYVPQPVQPLPTKPGKILGFLRAWFGASKQARDMLRDIKPAAVLGLGGFASGPLVKQATKMGFKVGMLNPDAVPGKANMHLSKFAQAIFTQFDQTKSLFKGPISSKVQTVGCPVRKSFIEPSKAQALEFFGLQADKMTLLVNGGSLGAASINEAILELTDELEEIADRWQVLHITGPSRYSSADCTDGDKLRMVRMGYCGRMDLAYAAADLSLCRGGASTVCELAVSSTASVIMPYPYHRDMHQLKNAEELVQAEAGIICTDTKDPLQNAEKLENQLIPLMNAPEKVIQMQKNTAKVAKMDAAQTVAQWMSSATCNNS